MLPATKSGRPSLADVLPSCLAAIFGEPNSLALPPVDRAVVLLVDGLGVSALRARAGHARTLARALTKASVATAGFPTTTAANLATLTTGEPPGIHGLVGYTVLDPAHDRIVNQLTGDLEFTSPQTLVAFALGITLFAITLALNIYALYIVRKYREQYE